MRFALDEAMHSLKIAPSRRQVAMWLEFAFSDDISQVHTIAAGSSRRTMPLPAIPEPVAQRSPTSPVDGAVGGGGEQELTDRQWNPQVRDDHEAAIVTESSEVNAAVRRHRETGSPDEPRPRIASPQPSEELVPRITFRPATINPYDDDD